MDTRGKFETLRAALAAALIERDEEVQLLLLGLLAGEHVLLVGPPGTGKSLLCSALTSAVGGARKFETLLTKFSTPEELFGPVSVQALKADRYERLTAGYLPEAHFAFVDEVWKASSAILNTLLTLMQERRFDNGGRRVDCPLRLMVAASNEWPVGDGYESLGAAFDRFLIRKLVRPVSAAGRERLFIRRPDPGKPVEDAVTLVNAEGDGLGVIMPLSDAGDATERFCNLRERIQAAHNAVRFAPQADQPETQPSADRSTKQEWSEPPEWQPDDTADLVAELEALGL
jgi:MoxR-like ATPase